MGRLDRLGIEYVIGGSSAATLAGEPRSTADIDIAVDLGVDDLPSLLADTADAMFSGVSRTQADRLDHRYLSDMADAIDLRNDLDRVRSEAD